MGDKIEIYDVLLVVALIAAAWKALFGREAFTSTVFFIVYGLLMAMAWIQLGAVDVALAEACIGAGLTGVLLIGAIRQFELDPQVHEPNRKVSEKFLVFVFSALILAGLSASIIELQEPNNIVQPLVAQNLSVSGSSHPVTSVLLNFRAFDTWLELGVLLLASIAAISIHQIYDPQEIPAILGAVQGQPRIIARTMLPLLTLIGFILLWYGSHAPGGAFQAGALIGAAGILLQIGGLRSLLKFSTLKFRLALALGFTTFLIIAGSTFFIGGKILEYPESLAGNIILILESAATISIALTLNALYACSHPWTRGAP